MALSNRFGWLVLTTGNKSEMSVGYTTLYGDLAGGFAVIKDVPKTLVYGLCRWRNSDAATPTGGASAPIPPSIIDRAPSAELRPDQRDEDSLPPYELLDRILQGYIELHLGREQLIAHGLPGGRGRAHDPPRRPSPSTSAARRPPGSRSPNGPLGVTAACRSPTATGAEPRSACPRSASPRSASSRRSPRGRIPRRPGARAGPARGGP